MNLCVNHYTVIIGQDIAFNAQEKDSQAVKKIITGLLTLAGFVNLDAEDVKAVAGGAESLSADESTASGENRCSVAAHEAAKNLKGAKKLLLSVTSGPYIALAELTGAATAVAEAADHDAALIWGHVIDKAVGDAVKVSVAAAVQP